MAQTIKLKRSSVAGRVPTTSDLELGEIAINTADGKLYIKKDVGGTESIIEIGTGNAVTSSFTLHEFTATASQTTFTGTDSNGNVLEYDTGTPPKVQVFLNGVLLDFTTDYTASNGTSVVLAVGASLNDTVQIAAYKSVSVDSDLSLSDNTKILLGNSDDLQLYHDGSNSIINDAGTGNLQLQVGGTTVAETSATGLTVTGEVNTDSMQFDTTEAGVTTPGQIAWNTDTGTLELGLNADVNLELGEQTYFQVKAAQAISKGDVVYASGAVGGSSKIEVSKYIANNTIEEQRIVGLAAQDMALNDFGFVISLGTLRGLQTDGQNLTTPETWVLGDILYASAAVAGELTRTRPSAPNQAVPIAFITAVNSSAGALAVRAYELGSHLTEIHDVEITSVADNDLLQWNASASRWENVAGTTSNIAEGTNLYWTTARGDANFTTNLATSDTDDLSEGATNLYYTSARANADFDTRLATKSTTDLAEGTNLYYTDARFDTRLGTKSTTDLAEGTNLYYTSTRFDTAFSAKTTDNLSEGATNLYYTSARANTDFDTRLATKTTDNLSEGTTNLYYTDARVGSYLTANSYATQTYVSTAISNLVDSAPATLDTLNELAAALGDDPNFATTVTNSIATKLPLAGGTLTGKLSMFENNEIFGLSGTIADYPRLTFYSSEGTHASKTQTLTGDVVGQLDFSPYTGSSYTGGGKIVFLATEDIISTQRGTEARIYSTKTGQAAQSYHQFKDDELYIKNVGGSTYKYWHEGNDGAGSSLDADLLDGQHGSYYYSAGNPPPYPSDADTVDGLHAASFLRSDANDTHTHTLTFSRSSSTEFMVFPSGATLSSVNASGGDLVLRNLGQLRLTDGNTWDWNAWAGIKYDTGGSTLYIGGPAGAAFNANASPSNIDVNFVGLNSSGLKKDGNVVFHAGNDGSGSGLDADLLDGQHGSYYAPASSLSNYVLKTGDTMSGALTVNSSISALGNIALATSGGLLHLGDSNSGDSAGAAQLYYHATDKALRFYALNGSGSVIGVDEYQRYNGTSYEKVWDSGNDGSGSGLDADLLDGQHGSYYAAASHNHSLTLNGDVSGSGTVGGTITVTVNDDSHNHNTLERQDNRTISPSEISSGKLSFGFTSWANNNTAPYADFLHMRSYTDSSGGSDNLLMLNKSSKNMRLWQQTYGSTTAYASYVDFWHTGNDGSGSGLDADLLDGQHGSYYAPVSSLSSYVAKTGDTMSGLLNLSRSSTSADVNYLQISMPSWGGSQGYLKSLTWHDGGSVVSAIGSEFDGSKVNIHFHSQYNGGPIGSSTKTLSVYGNGNVNVSGALSSGAITSTGTSTFAGIQVNNSNTALTQSSGNVLRITTDSGYVNIGPANTSWSHFSTDRSKFYFDAPAHFNGQIYNYIGGGTTDPYWRAGNDGSGSGLDADLLDGVQGSNHLRVLAGGTEANLDSYTDNGIRTIAYTGYGKHLLSWNLGSSPGTIQQEFHYGIPSNGWRIRNKTDNTTWSNWGYVVMTSSNPGAISTVWHSNNDGSGSGLDADTLDGVQATGFLYRDVTDSGRNINLTTDAGSAAGLYVENSANAFRFQLYGDGVNYGFLDGKWAGWDLKKEIGGNLTVDHGGTLYTVWDAYNDGSGSGLDADLLDGQHGSYYAPASTALTTSTTFGGDVSGTYNAIVVANDSHNHTLLAKKSDYSWSASTNGRSFTEGMELSFVQASDGYPEYGSVVRIHTYPNDGASAELYFPYSNTYGGNALRYRLGQYNNAGWTGWHTVWSSLNDGSGSGLDADLLDGQHGSYYQPASTAITTSNIGSQSVASAAAIDGIGFRNGNSTNGTSPDNIPENGTNYVNSISLYGQTDGALYSQAYSTSWVHQIYGDYRTGNIAVRGRNNGTWQSWKTIWSSDNDGSGSGLDADLLDGSQGSYYDHRAYTSTSNYLGGHYVSGGGEKPNNSALGAGKLKPIMLSGGNVGVSGSWNDVLWMSTYTGSDVKLSTAIISSKYDATSVWINKANYDSASWGTSYLFWNSGNDGSGSGLDADTLDGFQLSSMLYKTGGTGYYRPNTWIDFVDSGTAGLYWSGGGGAGWHIHPTSIGNMRLRSGESTYCQIELNTTGTSRAFIYADNGNNAGWLNSSAGWRMRLPSSGSFTRYEGSSTYTMWDSGNDGSGSGLDADLLDGLQPSQLSVNRAAGLSDGGDIGSHPGSSQLLYTGQISSSVTGLFAASDNSNSIITVNRHPGDYNSQLGFSSNGRIYYRKFSNTSDYTTRGWDTVWTSSTDGSGSGLDADLLDGYDSSSYVNRNGTSYYQVYTWLQLSGAHGLYCPTVNDFHFFANSASSYGSAILRGSRNGWTGILFSYAGGESNSGQHLMFDSAGNGGIWSTGNTGDWAQYYHRANRCTAFGNSTTSSAYGIYEQAGGIYSTGNITAYSDARIKENVVTIDNALSIVEEMRGVYYNKIDDPEKTKQIGFIAQEVNAIEGAKPLVTYAEDVDQYGVSYGNATALLVEAVKELSQQVKDLKKELEELKNG